jgi:hypothetical protein
MTTPSSSRWQRACACLLEATGAGLFSWAATWQGTEPPVLPQLSSVTMPPVTSTVAGLQQRLAEHGLVLERTSCFEDHDSPRSAYLIEKYVAPEVLRELPQDAKQIERWHGAMLVHVMDVQLPGPEQKNSCWLVTGPYVIFGHPELLQKARAALQRGEKKQR